MALKKKYKILIAILVILALTGLFYAFFIRVQHVKAGEIGVTASVGNPVDNSENYNISPVKGYVVFMPLYTDLAVYPTTIQVVSYDSMSVSTKDGVLFRIKPSVSYQLDEARVVEFYKAVRSSMSTVNKGYLKEIVKASYAAAVNNFTSDSLAANEGKLAVSANTILASKMNEIGLVLKNTISNLEYPESVKAAIALRNRVLQDAIVAESRLREVDALRKEDSLRFSALTPLAIQKMFIEKWDGKIPAYGGEIPRIYDSISKNK